jgi:hypothetical protein
MKLAPHDAELVEADAEAMYEAARDTCPIYVPPWDDAEDYTRNRFRDFAASPYLDRPALNRPAA